VRIERWHVDHQRYYAVPIMSNGRVGQPLELRPLLEQFAVEMGFADDGRIRAL
jgi:hypothetical protein